MSITKGVLKSILFKQLPEDPQTRPPVESKTTTLLILLKKRKDLSRKDFYNILLTSVAEKIDELHQELNYFSFKQYHEISNTVPFWFSARSFAWTRKHSMASWLCKIYGGPLPAKKYTVDKIPYVDCLIELQFPSKLSVEQVKLIRSISDQVLKNISDRISFIESNQRFHVVKADGASYPLAHMAVNRGNPNKTKREAQNYWINSHGRTAANNVKISGQKNYYQIHSVESSEEHFKDSEDCLGVCINEFDGTWNFLKKILGLDFMRYNLVLVVDEFNCLCNIPGLLLRVYDMTKYAPPPSLAKT